MPLPETLREGIEAARSMIGRARAFDVQLQAGNAKAMLSNALAYVAEDTAILAAVDEAKLRIEALPSVRDLDEARESALRAIGTFELTLAQARPNELAKALGVDWF